MAPWLLGFRRLGFDVYYVEERRAQECMEALNLLIYTDAETVAQ